ncbi:hypothetical protein [Nostoc sp. UHCC 0302]|uniref:hypothetical protein n=1 Tax=Nostoc sp. UHCC 0302 TaxID=3134896 RepID=UPI00311C9AB9
MIWFKAACSIRPCGCEAKLELTVKGGMSFLLSRVNRHLVAEFQSTITKIQDFFKSSSPRIRVYTYL